MDVRTYRAATMQEALALVRRELGSDAAVLHTRELYGHSLLRWIPGLRKIEVTAALDVNVPSRVTPRSASEPPRVAAAPAVLPISNQPTASASLRASAATSETKQAFREELRGQLNELQSMVENLCRRSRASGRADLPESLFRVYAELIDVEVAENAARDLVERL